MTSPEELQEKDSIPEELQLVNTEYVTRSHLLTSEKVENIAENDIVPFFRSLEMDIKRIPRAGTQTVDYEYKKVHCDT
jgi:hypothetical protein